MLVFSATEPHRAFAQEEFDPEGQVIQRPTDLPQPSALSAPLLAGAFACGTTVSVDSVVPGSTLQVVVLRNMQQISTRNEVISLVPARVPVGVTLQSGDRVEVRQRLAGQGQPILSPPTTFIVPAAHVPLAPQLSPDPIYRCGAGLTATTQEPGVTIDFYEEPEISPGQFGARNLLGSVPEVRGQARWFELLNPSKRYFAVARRCQEGPPSAKLVPVAEPSPVPVPNVQQPALGWGIERSRDGANVFVENLVPGSVVEIRRNGQPALIRPLDGQAPPGSPASTQARARYPSDLFQVQGVLEGDTLTLRQGFCGGWSDISGPVQTPALGTFTGGTCSGQPQPPAVRPPKPGDTSVSLLEPINSSLRIQVYARTTAWTLLGQGGGSRIALSRAILQGEQLLILGQDIGCPGAATHGRSFTIPCATTDVLDPLREGGVGQLRAKGAVGFAEQDLSPVSLSTGRSITPRVALWYPAEREAVDARPRGSDLPLIVVVQLATSAYVSKDGVNGSCEPGPGLESVAAHLGYVNTTFDLASLGFVVASLDMRVRGCAAMTAEKRNAEFVELTQAAVQDLFFGSSGGVASQLRPRLAPRVGYFGHSSGGYAVARAAADCASGTCFSGALTTIGVLLVGAHDGQWLAASAPGEGPAVGPIVGAPVLALSPEGDEDVRSFEGVHHYDRAVPASAGQPGWFKSHMLIRGTGHASFNSRMFARAEEPDSFFLAPMGEPARLSAELHAAVLQDLSVAFFLAASGRDAALVRLFDNSAVTRRPFPRRWVAAFRETPRLIQDFDSATSPNVFGLGNLPVGAAAATWNGTKTSPSEGGIQHIGGWMSVVFGGGPGGAAGAAFLSPFPPAPTRSLGSFSSFDFTISPRVQPIQLGLAGLSSSVFAAQLASGQFATARWQDSVLLGRRAGYDGRLARNATDQAQGKPSYVAKSFRVPVQCLRVGLEAPPLSAAVNGFGFQAQPPPGTALTTQYSVNINDIGAQ
jgi:hypothetical protein